MLLSGKLGYVNVGGVTYSFDEWSAPMKVGLPKVSNWNSGGAQALVVGIFAGTVEISGPWDVGNMPFVVGNQYIWNLGVSPAIFIAMAAIIESITPSNKLEDAPRVKITAQSNGLFNPYIV